MPQLGSWVRWQNTGHLWAFPSHLIWQDIQIWNWAFSQEVRGSPSEKGHLRSQMSEDKGCSLLLHGHCFQVSPTNMWKWRCGHAHSTSHEIKHLLVPVIQIKGCGEPYYVHHICCLSFRQRVQSLRSTGAGKILVSIISFALTHMICTTDSECLN